jgi:hypothetical protein
MFLGVEDAQAAIEKKHLPERSLNGQGWHLRWPVR